MSRLETFSLVLVVLCVAALGISIIVEASKFAMLRSRRSLTQSKLERRRKELEEAAARAEAKESAADRLQAQLESLNADRQKTLNLIKSVNADRIEMIHELGMPDHSVCAYESPLTPTADFSRLEERRIMFHRDIWKKRNSALIWADTAEAAEAALERVFAARSAVQYGKPKPHPELSKIPGSEAR